MQGRFLALRHDQSAKQRGDVRVTQRATAQWLPITDGGPTVSATDYRSCHSATKDATTLPPHAQERAAPPPQQKASSSIPLADPRRDRIPLKSTEAVRIPLAINARSATASPRQMAAPSPPHLARQMVLSLPTEIIGSRSQRLGAVIMAGKTFSSQRYIRPCGPA